MKIVFVCFALIVGAFSSMSSKNELSPKSKFAELPKLAILGTFHFAGSNDFSAIVMDSIYSDKRQKQIDEVILKLREYNPTKILVEREPYLNDSLTQMLKKFLKEPYTLPANELYQIGFKLAVKLDLDTIYGIDYQMEFESSEFSDYLMNNQLAEKFQIIINDAQKFAEEKTKLLKNNSLLEVLTVLNNNQSNEFNKSLYTEDILHISDKLDGLEVDVVSNWYKRNLLIKKNIDKLITKEDRLLVIIGAGHKAILDDFYRSSKSVTYINVNQYLDKK